MSNTMDRLVGVIAIELSRSKDSIEENSRFIEDLEADSIDTANILSGIQQEFRCQVNVEEVEEIMTVKELADYLERHLNKSKQ